ncbi:MAG: AAA family ATPase [Synergistaceae bacterium]|jgi:predicted ATPase|nr:AAA family ATPase [Synergistaceae bacterium]
MNQNHLSRISIKGYKSIDDCDVQLKNLNILIGSNGAGKSAFIEFFNMINCMFDGCLQEYVASHGGPDAILRFGSGVTKQMELGLYFGKSRYHAALRPTEDGRLVFSEERLTNDRYDNINICGGHFETRIREYDSNISDVNCQAFHFNEFSAGSPIRHPQPVRQYEKLSQDGSNFAPYLYALKKSHFGDYIRIVKRLRIIAPFFDDFYLAPDENDPAVIRLRWLESGCDKPLGADLLSDGVLRFACLLAVFRYPKERRPDILLIDEPDLSLHPKALELLYHIINLVSNYRQVICSTQSTELLNKFSADDIIVLDKTGGKTLLYRIDEDELEEWLANKTITEMWANSIIGGLPSR